MKTYILGGGTALLEEDLKPLKGRIVLGLNIAGWMDEASMLVFGDTRFFKRNKEKILAYEKRILTFSIAAHSVCTRALFMQKTTSPKLCEDGKVAWGMKGEQGVGNTGAAALNAAVWWGAKDIVLVGFDMSIVNGKKNFHDEYDGPIDDPFEGFIKRFESFQEGLKKKGVKVVNTAKNSRLRCFPYKPLREVIDEDC